MPFYLYQMSYSTAAVKGMIAAPTDREAAAKALIESVGGALHRFFFSFGPFDVLCLVEAADDKTVAAISAAVAASGAASSSATTKLLTAKEAMEAMTLAGKATASYRPPMH